MEWFVIIAGLVGWLIYRGSKVRKRENREVSQRAAPRVQPDRGSEPRPGAWSFDEGRFHTHARSTNRSPARWVPSGEMVKVGGFSLEGGMFYLGGVLPDQTNGSCGNCVIDPAAEASSAGEDREGRTMPYWPSYQSISPIARRTYLSWLSGGRDDPSVGIGYVFLYFYGLERRMFVDQARQEASALITEVRRLLDTYGDNGSLRGYASKFLDAAELVKGPEICRPPLRPDLRNGYEIPLSVRLHLGGSLRPNSRWTAPMLCCGCCPFRTPISELLLPGASKS